MLKQSRVKAFHNNVLDLPLGRHTPAEIMQDHALRAIFDKGRYDREDGPPSDINFHLTTVVPICPSRRLTTFTTPQVEKESERLTLSFHVPSAWSSHPRGARYSSSVSRFSRSLEIPLRSLRNFKPKRARKRNNFEYVNICVMKLRYTLRRETHCFRRNSLHSFFRGKTPQREVTLFGNSSEELFHRVMGFRP